MTGGHVVKGYLDPPDDAETRVTIDGRMWHHTGDAGRFDSAGRLWLLGRASAGWNGTYPFALETAARSVANVRQATAFLGTIPPTLAVSLNPAADVVQIRRQLN